MKRRYGKAMRPNSTAMAKVGASSRRPGASKLSTHGMASISTIENGTSTSSSAAWAWRAKASASARPWSCSSRENRGTNAAEKAPSANRRRKKFGSLKATKKASATGPEPSTADSTTSRTKPTTRLSSVKPPTVATARPRLICPLFLPRLRGRIQEGGGHTSAARYFQIGMISCVGEIEFVAFPLLYPPPPEGGGGCRGGRRII